MSIKLYVCTLVLAIGPHSLKSARVYRSKLQLSVPVEDPPPLIGCEAKFWNTSCCCFINFGILRQDRCGCQSGPKSCAAKAHIEYSPEPFRKIDEDYITEVDWHSEKGYLRGYQEVPDKFCRAAPVIGPNIDHHERSYECACSTSMSHVTEMQCGSGCDVANCKRTNPGKVDWTIFDEGRGRCCLSSYTSGKDGCPQEIAPITEDGASVIIQDAIKHARLADSHAFVPSTSEYLIDEMAESFQVAKEKKMSTSRSGAQFFFSGDYKYILKSIARDEYDVLKIISGDSTKAYWSVGAGKGKHHPQNIRLPGRKESLVDHIRKANKVSHDLEQAGFCKVFKIFPNPGSTAIEHASESRASKLARKIPYTLYGHWYYDEERSELSGRPTYLHSYKTYRAYWCPEVSEWRIQESSNYWGDWDFCKNHWLDPLNTILVREKDTIPMKNGTSVQMEDVEEVYWAFTGAFKQLGAVDDDSAMILRECAGKWLPTSLINTFAIAFEYRASTWMVVQNSVESVKTQLASAGFTKFYKEYDIFDVKPFPIYSDDREPLFKMHFIKDGIARWRNWDSVKKNLRWDVSIMDRLLSNPFVDYSLLISSFYINSNRMALDVLNLPNCVERKLSDIKTMGIGEDADSDYGNAEGSILVCFSIIDMLMEFTLRKTPENLILFMKWSDWSKKITVLFNCIGDPDYQHSVGRRACGKYTELRSKFNGVDIPEIPTARVQDVSQFFNADGETRITKREYGSNGNITAHHTLKCCCHSGSGECKLRDATNLSTSWIAGNPRGCGKLVGSGWHSFRREAGQCRVKLKYAQGLREHQFIEGIIS